MASKLAARDISKRIERICWHSDYSNAAQLLARCTRLREIDLTVGECRRACPRLKCILRLNPLLSKINLRSMRLLPPTARSLVPFLPVALKFLRCAVSHYFFHSFVLPDTLSCPISSSLSVIAPVDCSAPTELRPFCNALFSRVTLLDGLEFDLKFETKSPGSYSSFGALPSARCP